MMMAQYHVLSQLLPIQPETTTIPSQVQLIQKTLLVVWHRVAVNLVALWSLLLLVESLTTAD